MPRQTVSSSDLSAGDADPPRSGLSLPRRDNLAFAALLTLVFFAVGLVGIHHHEMWLDELQAWLLARHSGSLVELFEHLRYEGHPGLWHVGLYALSRFSHDPTAMQLYHLLIATVSVALFALCSPFTHLQKILFAFGYFPLYEYGLVSRSYGLGILLLFCYCTLFRDCRRWYLPLCLILSLLANTSAYGVLLSLCLLGLLLYEVRSVPAPRHDLAGGIFVYVLSLVAVGLQVIPPADVAPAGGGNLKLSFEYLGQVVAIIWGSYIPVPDFTLRFWNTNFLLDSAPYLEQDPRFLLLAVAASLSLLTLATGLLASRPRALALYLGGTLTLLMFSHVVYFGSLRHHGHLFMLLMASLWLAQYYPESQPVGLLAHLPRFELPLRLKLLTGLLGIQCVAGALAFTIDLLHPFSAAREVAGYLHSRGFDNLLLIGSRDYALSPLSGYLDRSIYYPEIGSSRSFVVWDRKRLNRMDSTELLAKATQYAKLKKQTALLILNYVPITFNRENMLSSINESKLQKFDRRLIENKHYNLYPVKFTPSILGDEDFYLYLIKYEP